MREEHGAGTARTALRAAMVLVGVGALGALGAGAARHSLSPVPSVSTLPTATTPTPEAEPDSPSPASAQAAATAAATSSQGRPSVAAPTPPTNIGVADEEPAPLTPTEGELQAALEHWLASEAGARSVAVGMAHVHDASWLWTGEAHVAEPLFHADDEYGTVSITKTFTEALVLREVASGHISLYAPMPAIAGLKLENDSPVITPRMLLQHTSGLVNYPKAVGYDPSRPITPREVVSLALHTPLLSEPGRQARYSNTNFHWLGLLLEQVTGRSYADLVADIAADVGLPHTRLDPSGRPGWIGFSSGGIRSTVGELARWGAALFTPGRVVPAEQLMGLTTIIDKGVSLGLWPLCPCASGRHGIRQPAALRQAVANGGFFYFPDQELVVVVHYEPSGTAAADVLAAELASTLDNTRHGSATR